MQPQDARAVDAAVVGGGFAGLTLACGLAREGWETVVLERRTGIPPFNRAITLQPNGLAALDAIGALDEVRSLGTTARRIRFCNPDGATRVLYDYGELVCSHPYVVQIDAGALQQALEARLRELGAAAAIKGVEFAGLVHDDGAVKGLRYRTAEGEEMELESACVIGADGAASAVRAALGIKSRVLFGPDPYLVGMGGRPKELPDCEIAVYCGRGYSDGVAPMGERAYFWDRVNAENRGAVDARDLDRWREVYARRVSVGSAVADPLRAFDELVRQDVRLIRSRRRAAEGAVLIGEAAGTVHPQSAQGANLALEDAVTLADALSRRRSPKKPVREPELSDWQHARQRRLTAFQAWSLWVAHAWEARNAMWGAVLAAGFAGARVRSLRQPLLRWGAGLPPIRRG